MRLSILIGQIVFYRFVIGGALLRRSLSFPTSFAIHIFCFRIFTVIFSPIQAFFGTKIVTSSNWHVSTVGGALCSYRRGHGFKSRQGLNSFFFFSGLIFTTAHVVLITAKFAFIPDRREMANSVMWELYRKSHESVQIHLLQTFFRLSEYFKCRLPDLRNIFKFRVNESTYEFCEVSGSGKQRMKATGGFWVFNDNSWKRKKKKQTNKQTNRQVFLWSRGTVQPTWKLNKKLDSVPLNRLFNVAKLWDKLLRKILWPRPLVGELRGQNESSVSLASPSSLKFLTRSFCNYLFPKFLSIESQFV